MNDKPVIALVDDDPGVRDTLSFALRMKGYQVQSFGSAQKFFESYQDHDLSCVVLDLRIPDMDGLNIQRRLKEEGCTLPVIFISGEGTIPASVQAVKQGAFEFIEKPFSIDSLSTHIENALADRREQLSRHNENMELGARFDQLSRRERQIMYMATEDGLSNKMIARELAISPRTVEHHRARLMEKMQASNIAELCRMAAICSSMGKDFALSYVQEEDEGCPTQE